MIVASEGNHLETGDARQIYEMLRLHILAMNEHHREFTLRVEELPGNDVLVIEATIMIKWPKS